MLSVGMFLSPVTWENLDDLQITECQHAQIGEEILAE
jgi:hypothetical protein